MKVGIDFRPVVVAPFSGIARQASALYEAVDGLSGYRGIPCTEAPLDHEVRVTGLCPQRPAPAGMQQPQARWRFEAGFLPAALKEAEIDLYVATANMGLPLGRKGRRKQVVLIHDLFQLTEHNFHRSRLKALIYRWLDRCSIAWSIRVADAVWCPSHYSAGQVVRLFPGAADKVRVLPNHVSELPAADAGGLPELPQSFWLLVGTREPRKNIAFFLTAWQQLRADQSLPELVLVGEAGDFPEFAGVAGIHWLSGLSDEQLSSVYQQAECLWQPSWAEGFGMPVVEALGLGTPVVLARGSALDEVAPSNMPRFGPQDAEELKTCMSRLAQKPLAKNRPEYAEWARRYSMQAYRARIQELLQELSVPCND